MGPESGLRLAKKAPGSRLRELEEASEEWLFLVGPLIESLLRSLHWQLAIAHLHSSITQSLANTRKQWPTYLTSGSCTSRHSTIALLATLTLFTFALFGVARTPQIPASFGFGVGDAFPSSESVARSVVAALAARSAG